MRLHIIADGLYASGFTFEQSSVRGALSCACLAHFSFRNGRTDDRITIVRLCLQFPRPVYVGADLAKTPLAEALTSKGFDPTTPALFTSEGILCYLPQVGPCVLT